jgi:hypothetical protein
MVYPFKFEIIIIIIIIIIYLNCKWDFTPWQWYYNKTQHTKIHISHKITHHAQTKHSTQNYTNNKGHIAHNDTTQQVKLSLEQAVEVCGVVRC